MSMLLMQVREESVLSSYHRQTMSVFVGARLIDAPGTPCSSKTEENIHLPLFTM